MFPAGREEFRVQFVVVPSGVRLRVVETGPPGGAPVVLLHGWGASAYMYRYLAPALGAHGLRAIVPELRGHGLSDKPRPPHAYRTDQVLGDITDVVRILGLTAPFACVGQSMGGALALRLALDGMVSRLVLVNPVGLTHVRAAQVSRRLSPRVLDHFSKHMTPRWLVAFLLRACYGDPSRLRERDVDEYWAPSQFPGYARAMRALVCHFDWEPITAARLRSIAIPTLVVAGGCDRVVPGTGVAASRLGRAEVLELADAGHVAHEEFPERVDPAVVRFLGAGDRL